jgi:hypothetical protein
MSDAPWSAALLLLVIYLAVIGLSGYVFWLAGTIR